MKSTKITHRLRTKFTTAITVATLIMSMIPSNGVFAIDNKLYVSPTPMQMNVGTTFQVNVRSFAGSDQTVGTARGTVTYPANLLQVTSTSTSGSAYGSPTITPGTGTVGFNGSRDPAPSGAAQIFTINFKAIAGGTASVGFTSDSVVNNTSTSYTSGVYTVSSPNPSPPSQAPAPKTQPSPSASPSSSSSQSSSDSSSSDDTPQPTPDPTGIIDTVNVNPLYDTATVSWHINGANPNSSFTYGVSNSQLDKSGQVKRNPDGTYSTDISNLTPGQRYYFSITATASGGRNGTYSGIIITRGFPVTLTVTENKVPVQSGQVTIGSQLYLIGSTGKVTIGLAAGGYSGKIDTGTASLDITLTVVAKAIPADGSAPETQDFPFNLSSSPLAGGPTSGISILGFIGILAGGTAVLIIGVIGFIVYRRRRFESGGDDDVVSFHNDSPTLIIDDGFKWQPPTAQNPAAPPMPPPQMQNLPPPPVTENQHRNSVYLSEDEPLDMFEQAERNRQLSSAQHPTPVVNPTATGQNPSSQHSTTP